MKEMGDQCNNNYLDASKKRTGAKKKGFTKKLALAGMFAALAFTVAALCNVVPISLVGVPPLSSFLHYDGKDVIIALCGFILGPVYALAVSLIVAIIEMAISHTGIIGALMNFLSSAIFACTAALVYKHKKDFYGAVIGLLSASVLTTLFMCGWNYIITPLYPPYMPRETIAKLILPGFLPFNLIKSLINSGITLIVYKPITTALRSAKLLESKNGKPVSQESVWMSLTLGIILIASGVLAVVLLIYWG